VSDTCKCREGLAGVARQPLIAHGIGGQEDVLGLRCNECRLNGPEPQDGIGNARRHANPAAGSECFEYGVELATPFQAVQGEGVLLPENPDARSGVLGQPQGEPGEVPSESRGWGAIHEVHEQRYGGRSCLQGIGHREQRLIMAGPNRGE